MAKKKNPEQETENPAEEQVQEPETEPEEPGTDTQEQDSESETEIEEQVGEQDPEDAEEEQPDEHQDEEQQEENPAGSDENAGLRRDLLQARGELAAYRAGVAPAMVQDAVTLAMAEAAKTGEVTEAAVNKALEAVLKRHPEWKAAEEKKQKAGGFKLGADRDNGGSYKKTNGTQNVKRWNRYKNN